jgi:hypothetical protein
MILNKDQIKAAALQLDPIEREALAEEILLSIDGVERDAIDSAWLSEAHRRDAAFIAGQATSKPVDEVIARIKGRIGR